MNSDPLQDGMERDVLESADGDELFNAYIQMRTDIVTFQYSGSIMFTAEKVERYYSLNHGINERHNLYSADSTGSRYFIMWSVMSNDILIFRRVLTCGGSPICGRTNLILR